MGDVISILESQNDRLKRVIEALRTAHHERYIRMAQVIKSHLAKHDDLFASVVMAMFQHILEPTTNENNDQSLQYSLSINKFDKLAGYLMLQFDIDSGQGTSFECAIHIEPIHAGRVHSWTERKAGEQTFQSVMKDYEDKPIHDYLMALRDGLKPGMNHFFEIRKCCEYHLMIDIYRKDSQDIVRVQLRPLTIQKIKTME